MEMVFLLLIARGWRHGFGNIYKYSNNSLNPLPYFPCFLLHPLQFSFCSDSHFSVLLVWVHILPHKLSEDLEPTNICLIYMHCISVICLY